MPRALKACGGCGQPVEVTPCPQCKPTRSHTRTRTQRGYDNDWLRLRAKALRVQPWCVDCGLEGNPHTGKTSQPNNPLTGDHDVPLAVDPSRRLDPSNIVIRCRRCNSRKGAR